MLYAAGRADKAGLAVAFSIASRRVKASSSTATTTRPVTSQIKPMALPSNSKVASSNSPMASGGAESTSHSPTVAMADEASGGDNNNNKPAATKPSPSGSSTEYQLRKYLLLLATLVATVTYVAGLNLPGGAWQENTTDDGGHRHHAGDPILQYAHRHRYLAFYYCNATAFAASLVVSLLLLVLDGKNTGWWEALLRVVMVLDLLGLMGAYAAGSCRDKFTTIYSALLVCAVFAYVVVAFVCYLFARYGRSCSCWQRTQSDVPDERRQELHEALMLLATFAVTITYVAGLNPPGGFWADTKDGHQMSDPVLQEHYSSRYQAFYVCNTTAFVASLLIIILLVDKKLTTKLSVRFVALYGLTITALLGLMGAYAAGSCRQLDDTTYVICLIAGVLAYIFLQVAVTKAVGVKERCSGCFQTVYGSASVLLGALRSCCGFDRSSQDQIPRDQNQIHVSGRGINHDQGDVSVEVDPSKKAVEKDPSKEAVEKAKQSLVMLLATLVVSITYSAGLDPPGGLWPDTRDDHKIGDPILLTTHPTRYKVFFYSNSAAFVASLIVILMVQSEFLLKGHTLEAAMILDLFGLISAYAAGCCRDDTTSIYVVALAGIVLVYVVIHIVLFTLDHGEDDDDDRRRRQDEEKLENRRQVLLLLAILAATLTYQAGLTPPGGFWSEDEDGHQAGYPVLHDNYRPRYSAFFYCNAASFMASVALIVLLVNPNLYRPGIRCYALYVCMVVGMFGLMGAYAAGSSRDLRTSIYVLTLVVAVFAFVALEVVIFWVYPYLRVHWKQWWRCIKKDADASSGAGQAAEAGDVTFQGKETEIQESKSQGEMAEADQEELREKNMREYLMLLGVLAASVTYQTGLKPPGGLWQDDNSGRSAGSSILHYINKGRYHAFFYCNSTSFMASVVVIILLLPSTLHKHKLPLWPMHTAVLLDMLGLLGAYAAGSARDWETSRNVIYLVIPVLVYIAAYALVAIFRKKDGATAHKSKSEEQKSSGKHEV